MKSLVFRRCCKSILPCMFMLIPSLVFAQLDTSYEDDGRYDYGLSQPADHGMISEYNIEIPMRDGIILQGDIFRPDAPGTYPVIMAQAPYPRHQKVFLGVDDNGGVGTEHWYFEQANPEYWVPRGYIYISFSTRGYSGSEGQTSALDYQEFVDCYDAIEWAAEQPWSSGNIGLYGISYYAFCQYFAAGMQPPHLKAIVPWEGLSDPYRDIGYRGGIPCMFGYMFATMMKLAANDPGQGTDYIKMILEYPLMDDVWRYGANVYTRPPGSTPTLREVIELIDVPMLSVGNLNDPDLHLRGNVIAFRESNEPNKKLLLYTGTHWGSAYQPWANRTVLRFFDHWLKGIDTGIENEPAIDIQLRTASDTFTHVYGDTWPLEQTEWKNFYLDARTKSLKSKNPILKRSVKAKWDEDEHGSGDQVTFLTDPLDEDLQIAGPLSAHFWVSTSKKDVDLIVELRDFDEDGNDTRFAYYIPGSPDEPVTRGWLRASLRALDPERSLPHQPFYSFAENEWLTPGKPVAVDVELWPTSMVFKAGHRIGLTIHCGKREMTGEVVTSLQLLPNLIESGLTWDLKVPAYQTFSPDAGIVKIYTGGKMVSWLELPTIPVNTDHPVHAITISDESFSPDVVSGQIGDTFQWTNTGSDYHSSSEANGLWESQLINGLRSHNPETWWTKISWAGTFSYSDKVSGFEGTIEIPNHVYQSNSGNRVIVELGTSSLPEGMGLDVQLQSEEGVWQTVHQGTSEIVVTFSDLAPGNYAVRSRLRQLDGENQDIDVHWSPASEFTVD